MDKVELFKLQNLRLKLLVHNIKTLNNDKVLYETLLTDGKEIIKIDEWMTSQLSNYGQDCNLYFKGVGFSIASYTPYYVKYNSRGIVTH
jgi:hypothetical protein